jgi:nucleotide-binding universal stress UspA family protein
MKTILVPTDFSPHALHAMKFAVRMIGDRTDVKLVFFHATETQVPERTPRNVYRDLVEYELTQNWEKLQKISKKVLKRLGLDDFPFEIDWIVKHGEFLDNVMDTIVEHQVDLVIIGKSRTNGIKKFFYGSESADLLEKSSCAVLMVPRKCKTRKIEKISLASITLKMSSFFQDLVSFAEFFNAGIEIFHIHDPITDVEAFDEEGLVRRLKEKYNYENISMSFTEAIESNTAEDIDSYVAHSHPSILSVASYERPWYERIFNASITKTLAFETEVPLLVLKGKEENAEKENNEKD